MASDAGIISRNRWAKVLEGDLRHLRWVGRRMGCLRNSAQYRVRLIDFPHKQRLTADFLCCCSGPQGLNPSLSYSANDLCLMATILSAFLVFAIFSLLLPVRWYIGWWPGYFALGLLGGASIGVTVLILHGNHLLIESEARWALIGALAILGALMVIVTRFWGAVSLPSLYGLAEATDCTCFASSLAAH